MGLVRGPQTLAGGPQKFRPGQFWYTRTVSSMHQSFPAGGTIARRGRYQPLGPKVKFDLRVSEETWVGVDGTMRDRVVVVRARFASASGRASWLHTHPLVPHSPGFATAYRRPLPDFNDLWLGWSAHDGIVVGGHRFPPGSWGTSWGEWLGPSGWDVGDGLFSYRQLLSLPTRPAALRARLRRAEEALARREDRTRGAGCAACSQTGTTALYPVKAQTDPVGELSDLAALLSSPLPTSLRLALFHVAVTLPGARVNPRVRDSLGRRGVAVTASKGLAAQRLIFDPGTGVLLQGPNGTVVGQGIVDSPYALPKGVSPIHPASAPPQPRRVAISPVVGNPTTVFKLKLSSSSPAPVVTVARARLDADRHSRSKVLFLLRAAPIAPAGLRQHPPNGQADLRLLAQTHAGQWPHVVPRPLRAQRDPRLLEKLARLASQRRRLPPKPHTGPWQLDLLPSQIAPDLGHSRTPAFAAPGRAPADARRWFARSDRAASHALPRRPCSHRRGRARRRLVG